LAIDYSGFAIPKGTLKAIDRAVAREERNRKDRDENTKAKKRATGRCEVVESTARKGHVSVGRCTNRDTETHHLIGGIGRRNRGKSILAEYKLRVCKECHAAITANVLRPTTAEHDASTVRFWRSR
jgi:hypothetical protein